MARRVLLCLLALAVVAALKGGFKAKGATDKGSTDGDGSNGAGFTSPDGGDASALARAHCTGVRRSRDVIVYLGQKQHSTYDKTHKNTLNASMELLRHNMLRIGESDVVVWHEGDLTAADATALDGKANVRFCLLSQATGWGKPDWLSVVPESKFSAGYRFMIRFYAVTIWKTLKQLGYDWVMRMDDDSFILSPIPYNVFDDMRRRKLLYGYRVLSKECPTIFGDFVQGYVSHSRAKTVLSPGESPVAPRAKNAPSHGRKLAAGSPAGLAGFNATAYSDAAQINATGVVARGDEADVAALENAVAAFSRRLVSSAMTAADGEALAFVKFCATWPKHCRRAGQQDKLAEALRKVKSLPDGGPTAAAFSGGRSRAALERGDWYCRGPGRYGYYNNWFVTDVSWWQTPAVSRMISSFDRSNLIFTRRCNDLIFQTAVLKLFMAPARRKRYADFTYQHHTVSEGVVTFGGLETGFSDAHAQAHLEAYLRKNVKEKTQLDVEQCSVQEVEGGEYSTIQFVSPAKLRLRATSPSAAPARFESPFCPDEGKMALW